MRISDWSSDVCSSDLSEVVIFKSGGISAHQILAPLMIASLGVALVSFVFNERVLTRANRTLDAWQAAEYGPIPRGSDVLVKVWVRDCEDLINADAEIGSGSGGESRFNYVVMRVVSFVLKKKKTI